MSIPIPAEQVSAALHFLGIVPEDLVIAHVTPHEVRVKQVVRDERGNVVPDLNDPNQVAMATTVHPIDYNSSITGKQPPTAPTTVQAIETSGGAS